MNELALFAGAGGGLLATKWWLGFRVICYVEWDDYCIEVLKARIGDGLLDDAPIWDDARIFDGRPWRGCVDIITAGFPCQPFSVAGKQGAEMDERNMWPDTIRVIREVRPEWVLLENVPGLLARSHGYLGQILGELAESGYDAAWKVLSAAEVGAPHKRDRLWVVAHTDDEPRPSGETKIRAGHNGIRRAQEPPRGRARDGATGSQWWEVEPDVGRVANGVASRVDRLKAIGNGQVPPVVAVIWDLSTEVTDA